MSDVASFRPPGSPEYVSVGRLRRHAVRHLVPGHVQGHQRPEGLPVTVPVRHAEAAVVPEGVVVRVAVVHPVVRTLAVARDAAAPVDLLVVVPGGVGAVLRVHRRRGAVRSRPGTPVVVGVGEDGRGGTLVADDEQAGVRLVLGVARVRVSPRGIGEPVRGTGPRRLQRDLAAVEGTAVPGRRLDAVPGVDLLAGRRVGEDHAGDRVAERVLARGLGAPGQPGGAVQGVDDQLGLGGYLAECLADVREAQRRGGQVGGLRGGHRRCDAREGERTGGGPVGGAVGACRCQVDHEVAAQYGSSRYVRS